MTRVIGIDVETPGSGPRLIVEAPYVPSLRCKPWPGRPGLYIMEPDFSTLELRVMARLLQEEKRHAARQPMKPFRPVLPPFWPSRPARDPKRPIPLSYDPPR